VVCGNFDLDEAAAKVRNMFSKIPAGEKIPNKIPFQELPQKGERTTKVTQPGPLNYLGVAYHIPEITHEDAPALIVLSAILGGWRGLIGFFGDRFVPKTNRLYKRLVEGNIANEVNTYFPVNVDPCLLYFDVTLNPEVKLRAAKDELFSEIDRARDVSPNDGEMKVAFNQIRSWHAYENDGISLQALSIGFMERIKDRSLSDTLVEQSLKVSAEDVKIVARKYLTETNRIVGEYESIQGA
jgi:predicted Zn-dependent peptidase